MAIINVVINMNPTVIAEQTDLSKCHCCADVIYGNMYRVWLMPFVGKHRFHASKTDLVLCESCKGLVNIGGIKDVFNYSD